MLFRSVSYNAESWHVSVDSTIKIWVGKDGTPTIPVVTNIPDINSADNCTVTKYVYSPGQNASEVVLFKITNGGHTWPGAFPVTSLGNTNQDIKASGEIWKFFRNHSLQCAGNSVAENNYSEEINIFPNPTTGVFVIASEVKQSHIEIFNTLGGKVYSTSNLKIDISGLDKGIYFLNVETEKGISFHKIVKN